MSIFWCKYGTALTADTAIYVPLLKADGLNYTTLATDWTPVAGDVLVIRGGGTAVQIGTLPSMSAGMWKFLLTASELTAKSIAIKIVDTAPKAVLDDCILIHTYGHAAAMCPTDLSADQDVVSVAEDVATLLATSLLNTTWTDARAALLDKITAPMPEIAGAADIPASPTPQQALMLLYQHLRNNSQATALLRRILNDAGQVVLDAKMSYDGTTFQPGKLGNPE